MGLALYLLTVITNLINAYRIAKFIKNKEKHVLILDSNYTILKNYTPSKNGDIIDIVEVSEMIKYIKRTQQMDGDVVDCAGAI